jgi:hypothetical protein
MNINSLNLESKQRSDILNENITIKMKDLDPNIYWTPQLFIENAIGQIGEQVQWFTIKKHIEGNLPTSSSPIVNLDICEHRHFKGVFWEKLELDHVCIFLSKFLIENIFSSL